MKRPLSALAAIGGFSVAVAALSVATTASIVLLMPEPPAKRMTVTEAAAALRGADTTLERSTAAPPAGARSLFLESLLAARLGRPPDAVRAVWLNRAEEDKRSFRIAFGGKNPLPSIPVGTSTMGRMSFVLRPKKDGGGFETLSPGMAADQLGAVLAKLPQPAFVASVRGADGRWVSVAPRQPLFGGWRLKILAAFALSLLLLAPLAWLFARRLTRPFRTLATAIDGGGALPRVDGPRELRDAGDAIIQLRARLAGDAEERMRMLTAVAHDLRTPLTSLKLRIESVPEPQRSRMAADADRMQAMIHDVLAFARAADAPRQCVEVRALLRAIVADMAGTIGKMRVADGPEAFVTVVEPAFRRAIENLVQNAIDYAGGGEIDLREEVDSVVIQVSDTGPGIKASDKARMIRPFERGDASRNRQTGGAGLGLSIVQSFAEVHGGRLTLADQPKGGTIALLSLPAARTRAGQSSPLPDDLAGPDKESPPRA